MTLEIRREKLPAVGGHNQPVERVLRVSKGDEEYHFDWISLINVIHRYDKLFVVEDLDFVVDYQPKGLPCAVPAVAEFPVGCDLHFDAEDCLGNWFYYIVNLNSRD